MIQPVPPYLPGSPQHQSLLQTIVDCYQDDGRVLALLIYGSHGRDRADAYSDLDLEVVVNEEAVIDVPREIERIYAAFAQREVRVLFVEIAGSDGYIVLESLIGVALSYHSLQALNPYVLEGWRILRGSLDTETIRAAASANQHAEPPLSQHVHRALWLALGVEMIVQRQQFWGALLGLERLRHALAEIFAASRGGRRAYQVFEEQASAEVKAKFASTFPQYFAESPQDTARSLGTALLSLLNLIELDLDQLSNGQAQLGPGEREFINRLRARVQQALPA